MNNLFFCEHSDCVGVGQYGQQTDKIDRALSVGLLGYFNHLIGMSSQHPDAYQASQPSGSYWGEALNSLIINGQSKIFWNIENGCLFFFFVSLFFCPFFGVFCLSDSAKVFPGRNVVLSPFLFNYAFSAFPWPCSSTNLVKWICSMSLEKAFHCPIRRII